jgi:Na+/glutamate symporter
VSGLQIVGTIGGAAVGGAVTAAWGLAAGVVAGVPVWAWHFKRGLLEHERTFGDASDEPEQIPGNPSQAIQYSSNIDVRPSG